MFAAIGLVTFLLTLAVLKPWASPHVATAERGSNLSAAISPTTRAPTASPVATAVMPSATTAALTRFVGKDGRYVIGEPYLLHHQVGLRVPSGWEASGRFIFKDRGLPGEVGLSAWTVGRIYPDPCHWQQTTAVSPQYPPSAPVIDLIVGGLLNQKGRNASAPRPEIMSGPWSAWPIELSVPAGLDMATCDEGRYTTWSGRADATGGNIEGNSNEAPGQLDVVYVMDLDRGSVVVDAWHFPATSKENLAELEAVLDSIRFDEAAY